VGKPIAAEIAFNGLGRQAVHSFNTDELQGKATREEIGSSIMAEVVAARRRTTDSIMLQITLVITS
jgi:ribosomal protein L19E